MPLKKTAVALPADLLKQLDGAARRKGESRNALITRILATAMRARRDRDITRKLDELFADPALRDGERRTADQLGRAGSRWSDERW
jgi:hypothetical protein